MKKLYLLLLLGIVDISLFGQIKLTPSGFTKISVRNLEKTKIKIDKITNHLEYKNQEYSIRNDSIFIKLNTDIILDRSGTDVMGKFYYLACVAISKEYVNFEIIDWKGYSESRKCFVKLIRKNVWINKKYYFFTEDFENFQPRAKNMVESHIKKFSNELYHCLL